MVTVILIFLHEMLYKVRYATKMSLSTELTIGSYVIIQKASPLDSLPFSFDFITLNDTNREIIFFISD